jgi:hypothetical protein
MPSSRVPGLPRGADPARRSRTTAPLAPNDRAGRDAGRPQADAAMPKAPRPHNAVVATATQRGAMAAESAPGEIKDPEIEALDLSEVARAAAYLLKKAHPAVKFTSGRRGKDDQARAMASNVVKNRKWIEQTYRLTEVSARCQNWVDANPDRKTQKEVQDGLLSVLDSVTTVELAKLSKHLSGDAFDVQPVDKNAAAIKQTIESLPGKDKFLDKEGGLVRWHVQFR